MSPEKFLDVKSTTESQAKERELMLEESQEVLERLKRALNVKNTKDSS
jgi:hypothetical protein